MHKVLTNDGMGWVLDIQTSVDMFGNQWMHVEWHYKQRLMQEDERFQNTILLASTQVVYKAPHSTVQGQLQLEHPRGHTHTESVSSRGSSRKSQSVRLEHNTVESVEASCTYASVINASKDIQCIRCVQT